MSTKCGTVYDTPEFPWYTDGTCSLMSMVSVCDVYRYSILHQLYLFIPINPLETKGVTIFFYQFIISIHLTKNLINFPVHNWIWEKKRDGFDSTRCEQGQIFRSWLLCTHHYKKSNIFKYVLEPKLFPGSNLVY